MEKPYSPEKNNLSQLSENGLWAFSKAFQKWRNPIPQDPPEKNNLAQLPAWNHFLMLARSGRTLVLARNGGDVQDYSFGVQG